MSEYIIGIDIAQGEDQTMYCISKRPGRFMRLLNRLFNRRNGWKVIYCGSDPNEIRKWRYKSARIVEES